MNDLEGAEPSTLGEMAHICGERPGSNRHDVNQTDAERDDYKNLILLCPTHHTLIDKRENEAHFSIEHIHEMKSNHEAKVLSCLQAAEYDDPALIIKEIYYLLLDNREIWAQYGPASPAAMKDPNNNAVFAIWEQERLSTIVPNNRKIAKILRANRGTFDANEQEAISAFLIHAKSYEKWVNDEITYAGVVRFPTQFELMIRSAFNARIQ